MEGAEQSLRIKMTLTYFQGHMCQICQNLQTTSSEILKGLETWYLAGSFLGMKSNKVCELKWHWPTFKVTWGQICQNLQTTSSEIPKSLEIWYLAGSFLGRSRTKFVEKNHLDLLSRSYVSNMSKPSVKVSDLRWITGERCRPLGPLV